MTRQPVFGPLLSVWLSASLLGLCLVIWTNLCSAQQTSGVSSSTDRIASTGIAGGEAAQESPSFVLEYNGLPDAPSSQKAPAGDARYLSLNDRLHIYGEAVFRPNSLIAPGLGASFGQWQTWPPEWGPGGSIYASQMASRISRQAASESIRFALAAFDGEDPRYHRAEETGLFNRTRHVLVESFTSQTADGRRMPAFSRFAGAYGSAFLSTAWCPQAHYDPNWALQRGSSVFASSVGLQLVQEFIPQKYLKRFGLGDKTRP
jgi:hypothetical protein